MGIDEVVMGTPLSPSSGTTSEEVIFEHDRTDHFIGSKWTLESHFPPSLSIDVSSEVDEKTGISYEHIPYLIDQVALPYSSELEHDIRVKDDLISYYFYISIISFFRNLDFYLHPKSTSILRFTS